MATEEIANSALQTAGGTSLGVSPLGNVMQLLQNFGFFKVVLPFLLIFAMFYAILLKTGVLGGEDKSWTKSTSAIVAMVAAFLVIAYTPVVDAMTTFIPQASFLLVIALLVLMLFAFLGFNTTDLYGKMNKWVLVIVIPLILIFLAMIGFSVGPGVPILYGLSQGLIGGVTLDSETMSLLIGMAIVIGIPLVVVGAVIYSGKKPA
ncbi:MAG: hypothetical protein AABX75_03280 [Nanoarchaeota archaeon]